MKQNIKNGLIMLIIAIALFFLTPLFPFDELIAGGLSIYLFVTGDKK